MYLNFGKVIKGINIKYMRFFNENVLILRISFIVWFVFLFLEGLGGNEDFLRYGDGFRSGM